MRKKNIKSLLLLISVVIVLHACAPADGNHSGHEYMPDMAHSIAYEANYFNYYALNTWGTEEEYKEFAMPRKPVEGTVPRGYAGLDKSNRKSLEGRLTHNSIAIPVNGSVPYYYEDTEEERQRATEEIIENPFPITDAGLEKAESNYDIYCGICHGEKGDGAGYLVRDDGGVYPAQPANFLTDEFINASNGRYYHSIMYGKNVMGSYADKLSYEERWQVIHYIRSLQAEEKGLAYNENENTLNSIDIPGAMVEAEADSDQESQLEESPDSMEDGSHGDHNGNEGDH
ncbi:MAG: cytochrome c [Saprospiraceae bacterium]|nr:cytochrome c [Saprospiraceae bacterium]